jgi:hypothetical protein
MERLIEGYRRFRAAGMAGTAGDVRRAGGTGPVSARSRNRLLGQPRRPDDDLRRWPGRDSSSFATSPTSFRRTRPMPSRTRPVDPSANTKLMGLYRSSGTYCTQCEAEGFRRITYFLDRPDVLAVYTTRIEADESEAPVLLANGNPSRAATCRRPALRRLARSRSPSRPICSRWSAAISARRDSFVTMSGRKVDARIYVEHGKEDRCAYAMDALKRSMRWDEEASAANTISTSSTSSPCPTSTWARWRTRASTSSTTNTCWPTRDRDRRRLRQHRGDHRARIFPQLDRQPHHLPRLVPALPEGRPDRLRDQEFSADSARAPVKRIADVRTLQARASSPRMRARSRIRCGPSAIARSTTSTRRPSTRRAPRSSA